MRVNTASDEIAEIVLNRTPVNAFSITFLHEILAAFRRVDAA
jgi:enoyl-CoA hydratase/carnithine racemase